MTRFLITGGSGFIGSHLVDALMRDDAHQVVVLDRWLSEPLREYLGRSNFAFVEGNVLDDRLLREVCGRADIVYHFASILGTSETLTRYDPEEVAQVNVIGTLRLLKASRTQGVQRVIYPSTPDVPWLNPYKITKLACERFCQMFAQEYGLSTVILRLTNVYGPRERWLECDWEAPYNYQKVVPTFIMKALRHELLPVFGDGEQRAIYTYVDDVVRAMLAAAQEEGIDGEIVPIGTAEQVSVRDVAQTIIDLTSSRSSVEYLPMRPGEVKVAISIDTSIAERLFGLTASVGLVEGLRRTIPYYARVVETMART